jgi:hypothetical protein
MAPSRARSSPYAVSVGKPDVEQTHVRPQHQHAVHPRLGGPRLTDYLDVGLCLKQIPESAAHHFMVIKQEHADRRTTALSLHAGCFTHRTPYSNRRPPIRRWEQ